MRRLSGYPLEPGGHRPAGRLPVPPFPQLPHRLPLRAGARPVRAALAAAALRRRAAAPPAPGPAAVRVGRRAGGRGRSGRQRAAAPRPRPAHRRLLPPALPGERAAGRGPGRGSAGLGGDLHGHRGPGAPAAVLPAVRGVPRPGPAHRAGHLRAHPRRARRPPGGAHPGRAAGAAGAHGGVPGGGGGRLRGQEHAQELGRGALLHARVHPRRPFPGHQLEGLQPAGPAGDPHLPLLAGEDPGHPHPAAPLPRAGCRRPWSPWCT